VKKGGKGRTIKNQPEKRGKGNKNFDTQKEAKRVNKKKKY
jgi:hypothetical protein